MFKLIYRCNNETHETTWQSLERCQIWSQKYDEYLIIDEDDKVVESKGKWWF